jgi:hypothetical protein
MIHIDRAYSLLPGWVRLRGIELRHVAERGALRLVLPKADLWVSPLSLVKWRWQLSTLHAQGVRMFVRAEGPDGERTHVRPRSLGQQPSELRLSSAAGLSTLLNAPASVRAASPANVRPPAATGLGALLSRGREIVVERLDADVLELRAFDYRYVGRIQVHGRLALDERGRLDIEELQLQGEGGQLDWGKQSTLLNGVSLQLRGGWPAASLARRSLARVAASFELRARVARPDALNAMTDTALRVAGSPGTLRARVRVRQGHIVAGSHAELDVARLVWNEGPLEARGSVHIVADVPHETSSALHLTLRQSDVEFPAAEQGVLAASVPELRLELTKSDTNWLDRGQWRARLVLGALEIPELRWLNRLAAANARWRVDSGRGRLALEATWATARPASARLEATVTGAVCNFEQLQLSADGQLRLDGTAPTGSWAQQGQFDRIDVDATHALLEKASTRSKPFSAHFRASGVEYRTRPALSWTGDYEAELTDSYPILFAMGVTPRRSSLLARWLLQPGLHLEGQLRHPRGSWDITVAHGSSGSTTLNGRWQRSHGTSRAVFLLRESWFSLGVETAGSRLDLQPGASMKWLTTRLKRFATDAH